MRIKEARTIAPTDAVPPVEPEGFSYIAAALRPLAVPCASLVLDPANARKHPDKNLEAIKGSLRCFGQVKSIVVRKETGTVVCGNGTLEAARALGWTHIAAIVIALNDTQAAALSIADNHAASLAEWDQETLDKLLATIKVDDADFQAMFDELKSETSPAVVEDEVPIDRADELQQKWQTAAGQLWEIPSKSTPGKSHYLLVGDATKAEDVRRLMRGKKADLFSTDPPYLVDYTGDRPNDSGKDWSDSYHEIDIKDAYAFYKAVFVNGLEVIGDHVAIYCWHAHKRVGLIQKVWEELGILDHQQIVWIKPTPVFGRVFWHFKHEPCMMGWRQGSIPEHDGDQTISSVWEIDYDGKGRMVGNDHPTQKPLEIFARPMRKHTKRGGMCFEPFSGSGSQLVAAEQLGRLCRACEIEPKFVAVGLERLANLGLAPMLTS
jgi:DNA modification methylase